MLISYLAHNSLFWAIPLLIQIICYIRILKKMNKRAIMGIVSVLGELEMSGDLFRKRRSFWRPAIIAFALLMSAQYLKSDQSYSLILTAVAFAVYGVFLARLYWRLSKQFGKKFLFSIGLILIPLVFLPILAFGKNQYLGKREFPPEKVHSPLSTVIRKVGFVTISAAELVALVGGCFMLCTIVYPARPIAQYMLDDDIKKFSSVTDSDEFISREDTLGAGYETAVESQRTRDYFFPDHSNDSKVVVMEYIIGSNLEDAHGSASVNIAQMKDSTGKGDGLDFVVEAGGSNRWFTDGIEDSTVGRYLVSGGKLEKVKKLDGDISMSEPDELKDFIVWTKENYPADRYMLVLWDHGGGFSHGFGQDTLNKRDSNSYGTMEASEIIKAIKDAGVKFDVIGFDACLMQNVEYANALEPYADFYLASEETEPAYGWFYTAGFGKLAEDPTLDTKDFGRMMVSSYDQLYRKVNDGDPKPENTLSLVDLTLVKPVYKELMEIYSNATGEIKESPAVFANLSAARSKAYQFADGGQVDLISFLTGLKKADYKEQVAKDTDIDDLISKIKTCVVYRNKDSAEGINGLAIEYAYSSPSDYTDEYEQLKAVKYKTEEKFFNNFCSILAAQQMKQSEDDEDSFLKSILTPDYTNEKWYVEGFEDYDTAKLFIDIPVTETEEGYEPELPEKTWDTILDVSTSAYIKTDDGLMYIGREHFGSADAKGKQPVVVSDKWVRIAGHMVCYESENTLESEEETIYKGTVRARLNGDEDITLHIEWDPVKGSEEGTDAQTELTGKITGYSIDDESEGLFFMRKGLETLQAGDSLEFLFDFYDEEGKLKKTKPYGDKLRIVTQDMTGVKDEPLDDGTEVEYYGILTDVYQRELMTEAINKTIGQQ